MTEVAASAGLPLIEAFHYQYHPVAERMRSVIASGCLGTLRSVAAAFLIPASWVAPGNIRHRFETGGGALLDSGPYCINILRMVTGEVPKVLSAEAEPLSPEIDGAMRAELRFPSGCSGRFECSMLHQGELESWLRVVGAAGELEVRNPFVPHFGHSIRLVRNGSVENEQADPRSTYLFQLLALVRMIREGVPMRTSAADGVLNMRVIDDVYRAAGLRLRGEYRADRF